MSSGRSAISSETPRLNTLNLIFLRTFFFFEGLRLLPHATGHYLTYNEQECYWKGLRFWMTLNLPTQTRKLLTRILSKAVELSLACKGWLEFLTQPRLKQHACSKS